MPYSAERLTVVWPAWFETVEFARQYAHQPEKLANFIYGTSTTIGRNLGNTSPADGWRYRGGGLMQTTGRDNYRAFSGPAGVDLESNPEKIEDPIVSLRAAAAEWEAMRLSSYADRGDFLAVCRGINRGNPNSTGMPNGWSDRKLAFSACLRAFGVNPPAPPFDHDFSATTSSKPDLEGGPIYDVESLRADDALHGRQTEMPRSDLPTS